MYSVLPNLVLGFHGCFEETFQRVLYSHEKMKPSSNDYDWLGHGIYFWENGYARAQEWAEAMCIRYNKRHPDEEPKKPAVIGAVISLGHCLDLSEYGSASMMKMGYELLKYELELQGKKMPENRNVSGNTDLLFRYLDCAVIERLHGYNKEQEGEREFDSVRGIFLEGNPVYDGAGVMEKTHVQLCIVNPNCIKGYFKPMEPESGWGIV